MPDTNTTRISPQLCRLWHALQGREWLSVAELAATADISVAGVRKFLKRLVELKLVEQQQTHPERYYRLAEVSAPDGTAYVAAIESARAVFSTREGRVG